MPELILHHYPVSPFAEKVRLLLGHKGLAWRSVLIPTVMPKDDLLALTGGYRKTPVLQIGADIYCDTALIADVLESLQPTPTLYPETSKGLARILAQWADTTLFWTAMAYNLQPEGLAQMFAKAPPEAVAAFRADRGAMSATGMTRIRPADATAAYKAYLQRLSDMLQSQAFVLGQAPCIADFAMAHPLWFTQYRTPALARIFEHFPAVLDWLARVRAIGHGTFEPMDSSQAIAVALATEPVTVNKAASFQDEHGIAPGSLVTVQAELFGTEPTEGELVAAAPTHYTLRRTDSRAGTVHVHFPRIGYVLKEASRAG